MSTQRTKSTAPEVGRLVHVATAASRGVLVTVPSRRLEVQGGDGPSFPAHLVQSGYLVGLEGHRGHQEVADGPLEAEQACPWTSSHVQHVVLQGWKRVWQR